MEKFYLCLPCAAACLLVGGITLAGCSNNDDNSETPSIKDPVLQVGSPSRVFVNDVPKTTPEVKSITLDDQQRVASMETKDGKVTFTYASTRAALDYDVLMIIIEEDSSRTYKDEFYLKLGSNVFVESAIEKDDDGSQNWKFSYTSDGQLNYLEKSDEDSYRINYIGGDIDNIIFTDLTDSLRRVRNDSIYYTSKEIPVAIENKGCVMEWDNAFNIDMDNMRYAYFAGFLGKATKHLPVLIGPYREADDVTKMTWTLNADNYPTALKVEPTYPGSYAETYHFTW